MTAKTPSETSREILFEFISMGNLVKVVAVDSKTGTEIVIQGPINAGQAALQRLAMQKMKYVLEKKGKG
jgi:hypothetical protein